MRVLITGGTGSFGTALARQLVHDEALERLVIYSRDEQKQNTMERELDHPGLRFFIGDVRDRDRLELAMQGIDTVVHCAAMKIIPTCERDPFECVHTNVIGAENVARAALRAGVERVIALSTDKAAAPLNLYGASKLAAEKLFVAANSIAAGNCIYSVVRYGNVVGSRGSVIPLFRQLAAEKRPLPITHTEMTRFWITLDQAVDFVLSCLDNMSGGEVFVPKLPSMRVVDLADAIDYGGKRDIVGIRPGEKLHETLITADEMRLTYDADDRFVIMPGRPNADGGNTAYTSDGNDVWLTIDDLRKMIA